MATRSPDYADIVAEKTVTYLDAVEDCLVLLPQTLSAAADGRPLTDASDALVEQESVCDQHRRRLCGAIGRSRPNYTDVYLRAADLAELFSMVDAIPDAAERFVRDFEAMSPSLSESTLTTLQDVAVLTLSGVKLLTDAIETYVESLLTDGPNPPVGDAVDRISKLESQCDQYRNDVLSQAFEAHSTADALVVRALLQSLDAVPNAVEDAADHLLFCWSDT